MSARSNASFEGMVAARLSGLEERLDDVLATLRTIEARCRDDHAAQAALAAEMRAVREKVNFSLKVIWSAIAWIAVSAGGMLLAAMRVAR